MRDPGDPWWMSWPMGPILGSAIIFGLAFLVQWIQQH
jgi:hypothetical protein